MPVSVVYVEAERPRFTGALAWWRRAARSVGLHHAMTSSGLIRRFVTLDPGRRCTEFRREESERILRAQPFLADATVTTRRAGDSVRVSVATVDEVPVVVSGRLRGARPNAVGIGTMNFLGAGMHVEARWEEGRARRDGIGGKLSHAQLFGRPWVIAVEGQRRPIGEYWVTSLSHPFITDLQRVAWHAGWSVGKDFAMLRRPDRTALTQPVNRSSWNVGGVLRFGPPRKLGLIGGMVIGERMVTRPEFALLDSSGALIPTTDTTGVRRYGTYDATSVAGVLGVRALTFTRVHGLETLDATQDVATGTQVAATLGVRPLAGHVLRDAFGAVDAYGGGRFGPHFLGARIEVGSRLHLDDGAWEHLVGSGRAAWYVQPMRRWTSELSVEGAGVWKPILPFQMELGDRRGGVRGYARSHEAGGQRLLARIEQRVDVARLGEARAAVGAAAFMDAGKVWAGDAPFGVTTPLRASAGAALLAAVPARSRRTMRAEIAFPVARETGARAELRFVVREPVSGFWLEPPRVRWARLSAVPEQVFSWP